MGKYATSLPSDIPQLRQECTNRGKDVVMLITSIKNKNVEMKAIRHLT